MIYSNFSEVYRRYKQKEQMIDWWTPQPHQREAYLSDKPIQLIEGGNRSGKTTTAIAKLVKILIDEHPTIKKPHPVKCRIIATVLREGALGIILNKLRELMPIQKLKGASWEVAYKKDDNIITTRYGDTIQLMSDSQDLQVHRGDDLDIVMIDEECREEIFDENLMRLSDRNGFLMLSMTAHNGMTWSYKKLVKASRYNERIGYYHLDTMSNYKINRLALVKNSALYSDSEFAIRIKGQRIANEGLVYYMYTDETHLMRPFDLPEGTQLFLGVDFGLNNPHAGSLLAITPDQKKFVADEYYVTGKTVAENGEAMGTWMRTRWSKFKLRQVACDPQSGAQRNEQTNETNIHVFQKAFNRTYGRAVNMILGDKTKGCVEHRIDVMRENLVIRASGLPDLMFFSNCTNHINEIEGYVWTNRKREDLNKFERPKDTMNHLMNALEYVMERNPKNIGFMYRDYERVPMELQYGHIGR